MSRSAIYKAAINNYHSAFPSADPYEIISSRLCMSTKNLRAKVAGERYFTLQEEETFFVATFFPQGFNLKASFLFHADAQRTK